MSLRYFEFVRASPLLTVRWVSARLFCAVDGVGSWCELGHDVDGAIGQSRQDFGQILADRDIEPPATLHDREDGGDLRPGLLATEVQPVLPTKSNGPHGVLSEVIGELEFRVLEEQP
jgi:hypothetical protein